MLLLCVELRHRPISTSSLNLLPGLHVWPINPVVYGGPSQDYVLVET